MKRAITLNEDTDIITVISYGKNGTVIQKWTTTNKFDAEFGEGLMEVYPSHLASGEPMEYPATFSFYYDFDEQIEYITCLILAMAHDRLPDGAPIGTKFLID